MHNALPICRQVYACLHRMRIPLLATLTKSIIAVIILARQPCTTADGFMVIATPKQPHSIPLATLIEDKQTLPLKLKPRRRAETPNSLKVSLRLIDGRQLSANQSKFPYAAEVAQVLLMWHKIFAYRVHVDRTFGPMSIVAWRLSVPQQGSFAHCSRAAKMP